MPDDECERVSIAAKRTLAAAAARLP